MNPVIRAVFFVMLMRAAEHFVDHLSARFRARHGFVYELAMLAPESAGAPQEDAAGHPRRLVPENYPSCVTMASPVERGEIIEVCGLLFEIDTIIHAEGRPDRLLLAPISVDMTPLGGPRRVGSRWHGRGFRATSRD